MRCQPNLPKRSKLDSKIKLTHVRRRSISTGVGGPRPTIKQDNSVYVPPHTAHGVYRGMRPNRK